MAIRTSIQPFLFYRDIVLAVLCAVFGAWGWYDYTITIPKRHDAFIEYSTLREAKDGFEKRVNDRQSLSEADEKEFQRVKALLNEKYTEVQFAGIGCKDIAHVKVYDAARCNMGDIDQWNEEEGECLSHLYVEPSELINMSK